MESRKLQMKDEAASSRKLTVHGSDISTSAGMGGDMFVRLVWKLKIDHFAVFSAL